MEGQIRQVSPSSMLRPLDKLGTQHDKGVQAKSFFCLFKRLLFCALHGEEFGIRAFFVGVRR